uniref:Uncharacterized protein n=1 Tax=Vitrella brassicaformis TaxID=1169539 RepID=A0A7S1P637_9ALVE|mmetsp:Transcript_35863/g.89361  ORF Transcript_35863/g.89361 Transcript_35863/m.89361 type:complete len:115 (+) Transcript_35863:140-484(+)
MPFDFVYIWWHHMRVGSRHQVRVHKGFRPQKFEHIGQAINFVRTTRTNKLWPVNVCRPIDREEWGTRPGDYILQVEKGDIKPTEEEIQKLEKFFGVPLRRKKKKREPGKWLRPI